LLTDGTGQVTDRYVYDAFGRLIAHAGGSGNAYQFAGEQRDSTGLDYLRARYYNSDLGRFISKDAFAGHLASPISENAYVYANANPINFTDPSGYESLGELSAAESINSFLSSVSQTVITGALFGAAFSVVHQDLEIIDGARDELSFDEVLQSTYQGAILGPLFAVFPEAAIPFAVMGIKTGVEEILSNRWATGAFDIAASITPYLSKEGRGTVLKQIEGFLSKNNVQISFGAEFEGIQYGSNNRGVSSNVESYWDKYYEAVGTQGDDLQSIINSARNKGITITTNGEQAAYDIKSGEIILSSDSKRWEFYEEFLHKKAAGGWKKDEISALTKELRKVKDFRGQKSVSAPSTSAEEIVVKTWLLQHGKLVGVGTPEKTLLKNQINQLRQYGTGKGY
jgi:RHS repeat-associated protein